jgi:transcriptional regulator with XRE-family HTH domain
VALIEARIAARLTQHALADRLGVAEQQIQRWEANGYAGVGLDRLQDVADALGTRIQESVIYSSAA